MLFMNGKPIVPTIFPDKTSQVWHVEGINPEGRNLVHWEFDHEGELMHLAQLRELLPNVPRPVLCIPYLPYARQDKPIGNNETFALVPFLRLLSALEFANIEVFDPHNPVIVKTWLHNVTIVNPTLEIEQAVRECAPDVICYPDAGARARYDDIAPQLPVIFADKTRDNATGNIIGMRVPEASGLRVLIVDDLCDGGMTFIKLAQALKAGGALEVNLYVSHGLFTKGTKVLHDAGIQRIFTRKGETL
jgi:ribose-phosphate pyrophosphokinase